MLVRLRVAEASRQRLQQGPGDLRVLLHERAELPGREPVAPQVGRGRDRRGAHALVDEGHLAEVVAGPERAALLVPHGDVGVAFDDDEEAGAAEPLRRDRGALLEGALLHLVGERLEVLLAEVGEERHLPESFLGRASGHGRG